MERVSIMFWKLVITLATLAYGFGPVVLYWNEFQSMHDVWTADARFHSIWFMFFSANMALISLYLLWVQRILVFPVIIGLCYVGSFWGTFLVTKLYGTAAADEGAAAGAILGIEPTMFVLGVLTLIFTAALLFIGQKHSVAR